MHATMLAAAQVVAVIVGTLAGGQVVPLVKSALNEGWTLTNANGTITVPSNTTVIPGTYV